MFLQGYRMIDMCWMGGGPFTAQVLGDLGFDVIKVMEVPKPSAGRRGGRSTGSLIAEHNGVQMSHYRFGIRNARSIMLDLKSKEGLEVFHRLIEKTDVMTEGFRPGVADRLGVGYEALRQINPGLVYAAITGYGQTGPYRDKPGHDVNFESIAGFIGMNGKAGGFRRGGDVGREPHPGGPAAPSENRPGRLLRRIPHRRGVRDQRRRHRSLPGGGSGDEAGRDVFLRLLALQRCL
jgi:crotonobetainyl-CoA:carnitine CoA-transferase CaiB-like acyl-CoA transferase